MASLSASESPPVQLNIVTWNINRKRDTQKMVKYLLEQSKQEFTPHVIFLQETCIGVNCRIEIEGWTAYYTQYSNTQKGVAILVNSQAYLEFKLYSQEIDRNGRYVVVSCRLLGQDYTLVSVYNHQDDTKTLNLLTPYLQKMTVGTLVIGGDFNTSLKENDRAKIIPPSEELKPYGAKERNYQHREIKNCVDRLMSNLHLVDVFRSSKNGAKRFDNTCFTYKKCLRTNITYLSRLDYFFIPKKWIGSVTECTVLLNENHVQRKDHSPLLVQLKLNPLQVEQLEQLQLELSNLTAPEDIPQNITGVEILAAIQSLEDIPNRPGRPLSEYKNLSPEEMKDLKNKFNHYINTTSLPTGFNSAKVQKGHCYFNMEYLIFVTILAQRLEDWGSKKKKPEQASIKEWSQLQRKIQTKLKHHPGKCDFEILEMLVINETAKDIWLYNGCPLSRTLCKLFPKLIYTIMTPKRVRNDGD